MGGPSYFGGGGQNGYTYWPNRAGQPGNAYGAGGGGSGDPGNTGGAGAAGVVVVEY